MTNRYERWRARMGGAGTIRSFLVRIDRETPTRIVATRVDRYGDEIGGEAEQRHVVIATPTDLLRRTPMKFSRTYGWLEPA